MTAGTEQQLTELPVEHTDPMVGRTLAGRYQIQSLVAAGGMGRVYAAEQQPLGRRVAVKVLTLHQNRFGTSNGFDSADPSARRAAGSRKRFLLEASSCAKLKHPNTVTLFDFGETEDDVSYIAMELLEGRTLRDAMNQAGPMPASRVIHITAQICASLREAHSHNVVHRDLKPGNVFLIQKDDDPDYVKVLDFGIVKAVESEQMDLTETGSTVGSPRYMAPEQILNKNVDGRADVYALGVLMFEMLTGRVPFECQTAMETMIAHLQVPAPTLSAARPDVDVPYVLEQIISRALSKEPDQRFASVGELYEALAHAASELSLTVPTASMIHSGSTARPTLDMAGAATGTGASHRPGPTVEIDVAELDIQSRRRRLLAVGAACGAVLAIGVVLLTRSGPDDAIDPPDVTLARQASVVEERTPTPEPESATEAHLPDTTVEEAKPPSATEVTLAVRSKPAGARVMANGEELCEKTPCDPVWILERDDGDPVTFEFKRPGHYPEIIERVVDADPQTISAKLRAIPRVTKRRKPVSKKAKTASNEKDPFVPKGFKASPYDSP
ncbi:MAG: serine/threonine-protein kinase [Myxococcota bacterium]